MVHATLLGDALMQARAAAFVLDDEGHYVAVNDAATRLTGYTRSELLELRAGVDLAADAESQELYDVVAHARHQKGSSRLRRKDGSVIDVRFVTCETSIGGLPYILSLCWEV